MGLLKVKRSDMSEERLNRLWQMIDVDCSGTVDFEEFLEWYHRYFYRASGESSQVMSPMKVFYNKLGRSRLTPMDRNQKTFDLSKY